MPKYIILTILFLSFKTPAARLFQLRPLCFSNTRNCNIAINALSLPLSGRVKIYPSCRPKTQKEKQKGVCHNWNGVLAIRASVALQVDGWVDKNQCYEHKRACQRAADIWNQLSHTDLTINAKCAKYNRGWWNWSNTQLTQNGIYRCGGSLNTELRIRIKRIK